jgi:hypothetical protein
VQLLAVRHAQVNLVFRAIETEPDSAFSLTAVDVVDEKRLNPLSHELLHSRRLIST